MRVHRFDIPITSDDPKEFGISMHVFRGIYFSIFKSWFTLFFFFHFPFFVFIADGKFESEYFQQTEESKQFRQEYEMRKLKQASIGP